MRILIDPQADTTLKTVMEQATATLCEAGIRYDGGVIIRNSERDTTHGVILLRDSEGEKAIAELKRCGFHAVVG